MDNLPKNKNYAKKHIKIILIILGTFFTGLAILGIFIPVLPTTPFLLISAALYARSSEKFYNWLTGNKVFGSYIKSYREGKGVPLRLKITTIALLWITIGVSAFFSDILWVRIFLAVVAVGVTVHIAGIRPKPKEKKAIKID